MQATRPPYTRRNVGYAALFIIITAGYVAQFHALNKANDEQNVRGYEGEASFLVVLPLVLVLGYSGAFALATGLAALVRGSRPIRNWVLLLGLLPTVLLLGVAGWLQWHWAHRVI